MVVMLYSCKRDMGCHHNLDFAGKYIVTVTISDYNSFNYNDTTYVDTLLVTNITAPYKFQVDKVPSYYANILHKSSMDFETHDWYPSEYDASGQKKENSKHNTCERFAKWVNTNDDLLIGEDKIGYTRDVSGSGGTYSKINFNGKKIN